MPAVLLFLVFLFWHFFQCTFLQKQRRVFSYFTISNTAIIFIYAYNIIGFPIIFFQIDNYRSEFMIDIGIITELFFVVSLSLLALVTGNILVSNKNAIHSSNVVEKKIKHTLLSRVVLTLFVLLSLGSFYLYIQIIDISALPIALFFGIDTLNSTLARSVSGAGFENFGWYQLFFNDVGLIALGIWYIIIKKKASIYLRAGFYPFLIFILFTYLMNGEKAKVIDVIIFLVIVSTLLNSGRITWKNLLIIIVLSLSFLMPLYWFLMGDNSIFKALWGIVSRLTTGTLHAGYHHFEFVDSTSTLYLGRTFPNPLGLLPFEPVSYTRILMDWVHGESYIQNKKVIASMPTHYWGEMYLNFRYFGVFAGSLIFGVYLGILDKLFYPHKLTPLGISFYGWLCIHFKDIALTGLSTYLVDKKLIIIIVLIAITAIFTRVIPKKHNHSLI